MSARAVDLEFLGFENPGRGHYAGTHDDAMRRARQRLAKGGTLSQAANRASYRGLNAETLDIPLWNELGTRKPTGKAGWSPSARIDPTKLLIAAMDFVQGQEPTAFQKRISTSHWVVLRYDGVVIGEGGGLTTAWLDAAQRLRREP